MTDYWRVALTIPEALAERFAGVVAPYVDAVSTFELQEHGDWLVEGTRHGRPDCGAISGKLALLAGSLGLAEPVLTVEPLPPLDWLSHVYQGFPPIIAGRYFIYGSHFDSRPPPGSVGLLVDAATAFGTGEHATTWGCLMALHRLARRQKSRPRVLDMGCGSGILAIAAAKTWRNPVAAVDIDPEAVRVTAFNARRNGVSALLRAQGGNGYHTALARRHAPYDVILSNILARPLARLAPQARRALRPGGTIILSGLLARQAPLVIAAHRAQGLRLVERRLAGEWVTLVMRQSAANPPQAAHQRRP